MITTPRKYPLHQRRSAQVATVIAALSLATGSIAADGSAAPTRAQSSGSEVSTDADRCSAVVNDLVRLACFDALYSTPKPSKESVTPASPPAASKAPPAAVAPKVTEEIVQATNPQSETQPEGSGTILERRARVNFSSKVKSLRAKDKQRMVFLLENGEVWMQSSPRNLPIKSGDEVTIKSGLMGGYILRTSNGVSSRVNRIK